MVLTSKSQMVVSQATIRKLRYSESDGKIGFSHCNLTEFCRSAAGNISTLLNLQTPISLSRIPTSKKYLVPAKNKWLVFCFKNCSDLLLKFIHIFWEGHKNLRNLHQLFVLSTYVLQYWWRFCKIFWPSHCIWYLKNIQGGED